MTTDVPVVGDAVIFMLVFSPLIFSLVIDGVTLCVTTDVPVVGNAVIFMEQISLIQKQGYNVHYSDLNLQGLSKLSSKYVGRHTARHTTLPHTMLLLAGTFFFSSYVQHFTQTTGLREVVMFPTMFSTLLSPIVGMGERVSKHISHFLKLQLHLFDSN